MAGLFEAVRSSVTARQAAEFYGLEVNRHGKALCIWHEDRNPSLSFKDGFCKCFACGEGGSSIDLTARLFDLTPAEAARKLNADFHIGADECPQARPRGPSKAALRRDAEAWRKKRWAFLCDVEQEAHAVLAAFPASDSSWENPRFRIALKALGQVQIELERLHIADTDEVIHLREEVESRGKCA